MDEDGDNLHALFWSSMAHIERVSLEEKIQASGSLDALFEKTGVMRRYRLFLQGDCTFHVHTTRLLYYSRRPQRRHQSV